MIPYFGGASRVIKAVLVVARIQSFRKDDFFPSRHARPDRASRAKSPYLCDVSRVGKSGICLSWILAYARMTAGGVLRVVGFFTGGDAPRPQKAVFMLPGCSLSQA